MWKKTTLILFRCLRMGWVFSLTGTIALFGCTSSVTNPESPEKKSPKLLIDEDFTDGQFDDFGAGNNGENWQIFGDGSPGFVEFKPPNGDPVPPFLRGVRGDRDFPLSLARTPVLGGSPWSGAKWWIQENGELQEFAIDKQDEVAVLKFTAFSDLSGKSRMYYRVEVAMLEARPGLDGYPHYGHDLSFEAEEVFNQQDDPYQVQLFANVENMETFTEGTRHAHSPDFFSNPNLLDDSYQNIVIWRNLPGTVTTNIEQWGEYLSDDYTVNSEMNSHQLNPTSPEALFNNIQITLFRNDVPPDTLLRKGVSADSAQIGITHVHVGITHKSDFNIDYGINIDDFFALATGWGLGNKTMLDGDANNDGNVDAADFQILKESFGLGTAIEVPRYQQDAFLDIREEDNRLEAIINMKTGEVKLVSTNGEAIALSGYQLISPGGAFLSPERKKPGFYENYGFLPQIWVRNPVSAENLWNRGLATSSQFEVSDGDINAIVDTEFVLGEIYDRDRPLQDVTFIWQEQLGQVTNQGKITYLGNNQPGNHR
jgi:hypothetical protein